MPHTRRTILLADDEVTIRSLVHATLDGPGYRLIEASDGIEALRRAEDEHPDLCILDWSMPRLCGIEVIRSLRSNPVTRELPIILLTARAEESDFAEARKLGVNTYLVKPFSPLELIEEVESLLLADTKAD